MCIQGKQNLQEGCLVMVGRLSACNGLEVFCQLHYQQDPQKAVIVSHAFGLQETTLFTRDLDAYWGRLTQRLPQHTLVQIADDLAQLGA